MFPSSQAHFTHAIYLSIEQAHFMTALTHLRALHISGPDAEAFLQAQLTANVKALTVGQTQFAAWCAVSGRVIGLGALIRIEDGFAWYVAEAQAPLLLAGLSKFRLRSKVQLEIDQRAVYVGSHGIWPATLFDHRRLSLGQPSSQAAQSAVDEHKSSSQAAQSAVDEHDSVAMDLAQWQLADIISNMPWFAAGERFLPQMLALEQLGGLSLKKGCFPGQEVISRMHFKGELKRELRALLSPIALADGAHALAGGLDRVDVITSLPVPSGFAVQAVVPKNQDQQWTLESGASLKAWLP